MSKKIFSRCILGGFMELLKRMKTRDTVEMVLKTIAAFVVGIMLIFLMEAMIHGIYIKKVKENTSGTLIAEQSVVYCEEIKDDQFRLYVHDVENDSWQVYATPKSEAWINGAGFKEINWRTPNAFDISISGVHYAFMAIFLVAILGFYGYRFYKLNRDYSKFSAKLQKTGKLFG